MNDDIRLYEEEIEKAIEFMKSNNIDKKLYQIYDVFDGKCDGCTDCCAEAVMASYVEFLNIYDYVNKKEGLFDEIIKDIFKYYFEEAVVNRKCPFLSLDNKCKIYEVRPITCRIYGHLSREDYERNYKKVNSRNEENAEFFKERYNLILPREIIDFKINYCKKFKTDYLISLEERDEIFDKLINLDSIFLKNNLLDEEFFNLSLVSWFVYIYFSMDNASDIRIRVIEEYLEKKFSETLNEILKYL